MAIRPVAESSTTDEATTDAEAGGGPTTVNVAVVTVRGSILKPEGTLKVALMAALGHTLLAFAEGLVDCTETLAAATGGSTDVPVVNVHT